MPLQESASFQNSPLGNSRFTYLTEAIRTINFVWMRAFCEPQTIEEDMNHLPTSIGSTEAIPAIGRSSNGPGG
jgi:hypothetical protein